VDYDSSHSELKAIKRKPKKKNLEVAGGNLGKMWV
jgi:hypothetical protein